MSARTGWLVVGLIGCEPAAPGGSGREPEQVVVETGAPNLDRDGDGALSDVDCDDGDPARHPGADEVCDGVDNNCDLEVDDDPIDGVPGFLDADGDGFGQDPAVIVACGVSPSLVLRGGDCDDTDAAVHPGAAEHCDGIDQDCDPATGEDGVVTIGAVDFSGVQEALDAAADGDVITVCDGTWEGPLVVPPIVVTIASWNGAEGTVFTGDGAGPVLVASDAEVTLRGVTVTGGRPDAGTDLGGGVSAVQSIVTVEDCVFVGNAHRYGGAIGVDIGSLTVTGTTFTDNTAAGLANYSSGGGIYTVSARLSVSDSSFTGNTAEGAGGALGAAGGSTEIVAVTFTDNAALGGGAAHLWGGEVEIRDSTFVANAAANGYGGALGLGALTTILDSTFDDNSAAVGGAIDLATGELTIDATALTGNTAEISGGAMSVHDYATVTVTNSTFLENLAPEGGGLDMLGADYSSFTSSASDWGSDLTDNREHDVTLFGLNYSFSTEDFTCATDWTLFGCE